MEWLQPVTSLWLRATLTERQERPSTTTPAFAPDFAAALVAAPAHPR